jgi:hypothetical protein
MSNRAGATAVEIKVVESKGGHAVYASKPDVVASVIKSLHHQSPPSSEPCIIKNPASSRALRSPDAVNAAVAG